MARRKSKKKTTEQLGEENELMKLKMMAEFGGDFVGSENIPPEVENQFLKQIISFHKQHESSGSTTVYKFIGEPEYNHVKDLSPKEVTRELKRLMKIMAKNGVSLNVLAETPEREIYRFITEELFKQEVQNVKMKGWLNQFIYEEFHPNAEYDVKNVCNDCIYSIFNTGSPLFEDRLSEELKNSIGLSLDIEDLQGKIRAFQSNYNALRLKSMNWTKVEIDKENQIAHVICEVEFQGQKDKGRRFKTEAALAEFRLKENKNFAGWWEIVQIACPVID